MRKYEIHLPLIYSDGTPVEQEKMRCVREELVAIFGSFLVPYRRAWKYDGAKYIEIVKIEIITTSDKVPKKRLNDFKQHLKESFQQNDILIMTHGVR